MQQTGVRTSRCRSIRRARWLSIVLIAVVLGSSAACAGGSERGSGWDLGVSPDTDSGAAGGQVVCGRPDQVIETIEAAAALGECDVYRGSFDFEELDIDDFEKLPDLREIRGNFGVSSGRYKTFEGLEQLTRIGGLFSIVAVEKNISFDALSSLRTVDRGVSVRGSDFSDLPDLPGLQRSGSLQIDGNPRLKNLDGLVNLEHIGGDAIIASNRFICEAEARDFLENMRIDGNVRVYGNGYECMSDE